MQFREDRPGIRRMIFGLVLALIAGLLAPNTVPVLLIGPVALTFLYVYAGMSAFIVCALIQVLMCDLLGGSAYAAMCGTGAVLPAALVARGIRWRKPFFQQMQQGVVVQIVGILAAVFIAYLSFGGNIIGQMTEALREQLEGYSGGMMDALLMRAYGDASATAPALLDAAERSRYIGMLLQDVQRVVALNLPGWLLSAAATAGVMMVALPNWMLYRRGHATEESYALLETWYVPGRVVVGMLSLYFVSFALYAGGMKGADSVFIAIEGLFNVCFLVQAAGSLARQLNALGVRGGRRNVLIALAVTVFRFIFVYYGCASALFGSRGLISTYLRKRRDDDR